MITSGKEVVSKVFSRNEYEESKNESTWKLRILLYVIFHFAFLA
jgi:hypothetical protein